jgi:hypothetical protein
MLRGSPGSTGIWTAISREVGTAIGTVPIENDLEHRRGSCQAADVFDVGGGFGDGFAVAF